MSNVPEKLLPPDLVTRLTTPPVARPYSASKPPVWKEISWIESKLKSVPHVPVRGSVVSMPSMKYALSLSVEP
jgi:hypothetical protein